MFYSTTGYDMLTRVKWTLSLSLTLLFQTSCIPMALLTRHLKLSDHDDTQIFTFVGTKSVTRDLSRDITSKDFRQEIKHYNNNLSKTLILSSTINVTSPVLKTTNGTNQSIHTFHTNILKDLDATNLKALLLSKRISHWFYYFSLHFMYTFR